MLLLCNWPSKPYGVISAPLLGNQSLLKEEKEGANYTKSLLGELGSQTLPMTINSQSCKKSEDPI